MTMINRRYPVTQIPQPRGSAKCWAACLAMILRRTGANSDVIVNSMVAEARTRGISLHSDDSLPVDGVARLASTFGLHHWHRTGSFTTAVLPSEFAAVLQHGPAMVFGRLRNAQAHVLVLNGIEGDLSGSLLNVMLSGYDPVVVGGGGGYCRSVAGYQNHLTIHDILHR